MYSRHELVWLTGEGWQAACLRADPAQMEAIARWRHEDWPAIVRRNDAGSAPGQVCLGIALPPDPANGAKRRIALQSSASHVARTLPALALADAAGAAPERWKNGLAALAADARGLALRVYGSLALQALTRQPYLSETSDIDLLFYPASVAQLRAGLALLAAHAATLPLDGEIMFPSGAAVAWKEWIDADRHGKRVLVKEIDTVRLATAASLLATLEAQ